MAPWRAWAAAALLSWGDRPFLSASEATGAPTAVMVDTDPALGSWVGMDVDDDLAIALLTTIEHLQLVAATATRGNVLFVDSACRRLRMLLRDELKIPHSDVPMACGPTGWEASLPAFLRSAHLPNMASELLAKETVRFRAEPQNTGRRLVWLALGAMTNIAAALHRLERLGASALPDEIVVLGGRLDGGWELNVWADPAASFSVLGKASAKTNITLLPIDEIAGAVVGMRDLDRLRSECPDSWIAPHISTLKRYAWAAGYFQTAVPQPEHNGHSRDQVRSTHGFRPWDVAAAAEIAYPGQLFRDSVCRVARWDGSYRVYLADEDVPCGERPPGEELYPIKVKRALSVPHFLAVMMDALCRAKPRGADSALAADGGQPQNTASEAALQPPSGEL
eukprot:TRINITY_DN124026_c0_g1_i1.p1 TRINITY_DN124026_c0_g1~~TRINITY_DN124026_c0_g1_i1.p1  ORF type:complete len:394 (+),score=58.52 TRINITY_DN124026_c0_g1_i1:82-1263(+)